MMNDSTVFVEKFKEKYDIGEDIPTDLTALFGKLNISVLPKDLEKSRNGCTMCKFSTDEWGRQTIYYREEFLETTEYLDRVNPVFALGRYMCSGEENFAITNKMVFSEQEKAFAHEIMMPRQLVEDILDKIELPTISALSKIFHVPCEFVKNRLDALKITKRIVGYN